MENASGLEIEKPDEIHATTSQSGQDVEDQSSTINDELINSESAVGNSRFENYEKKRSESLNMYANRALSPAEITTKRSARIRRPSSFGRNSYCICGESDKSGMLACSDGTGGCNGFSHPDCCGLQMTVKDLKQVEKGEVRFTCSLCTLATLKKEKIRLKKSKKNSSTEIPTQNLDTIAVRGNDVLSKRCAKSTLVEQRSKRKRIEKVPYIGDDNNNAMPTDSPSNSDLRVKVRLSGRVLKKEAGNIEKDPMNSHKNCDNSQQEICDEIVPSPSEADDFESISMVGGDLDVKKKKKKSHESDQMYMIEKVLGRMLANDSKINMNQTSGANEELFLVKWKGLSYLHCSWERSSDLEAVDSSARMKLRRFNLDMIEEYGANWRTVLEEEDELLGQDREYFAGNLVEVQRIIGCNQNIVEHESIFRDRRHKEFMNLGSEEGHIVVEDESSGIDLEEDVMYLVKWCALPYDLATWEKFKDIKHATDQILAYWDHQRLPSNHTAESLLALQGPHNLTCKSFQKMPVSPVFGISQAERDAVNEQGGTKEVDDLGGSSGLTLRDYQLEGVNWLLWNWWNHRPSILADEMGLGKTIQTTAFLEAIWRNPLIKNRGPHLIVAPLSLVNQWQQEIATWSPDMNVVVYHGNAEAREVIRDREWWFDPLFVGQDESRNLKRSGIPKFNVMVTTFEIALKEVKDLCRVSWQVLVVDEAHRLKNCESKLFQELKSLPREHCLLLTGTPLQNKTEELWALLHFCDSTHFKDQKSFLMRFGDLKEVAQVGALHEVLRPYLLRRIKEDVEKSLPPKEETVIEVSLTPVQQQFYKAIYAKNTSSLFRGVRPNNTPCLMNVMMELRKCCNHPYLNRGAEDRILSEIPPELRTRANISNQLVQASGKMVLLSKLLPRLKQEGHKVLIFSQMVKCLDLIEEYLRANSYKFERLDGSTRSHFRTAAVERFNRLQLDRFVMLLSTRAGGLGLNLTSADTVIIYDSDWNPQNDLQAQARAHRIGQTKPVAVYRLLTKKTYEMHMFHQASMKLGLDKAMLCHAKEDHNDPYTVENTERCFSLGISLKAEEIDHLLKKGAYDVFRDDDDQEAKDFVEADLDAIMERAAHKISYGSMSGNGALGAGFSKASFVSTDQKDEVDLDDPDFWKKAIGLVDNKDDCIINDEGNADGTYVGRHRKQPRKYDALLIDEEASSLAQIAEEKIQRDHEKAQKTEAKNKVAIAKADERTKRDLIVMDESCWPYGDKWGFTAELGLAARGEKENEGDLEGAKKGVKGAKLKESGQKEWGSHSRDRLVRGLLTYGFWRWTRICKEVGNAVKGTPESIDSFMRAYVIQLSLCALNEGTMNAKKGGYFSGGEKSSLLEIELEGNGLKDLGENRQNARTCLESSFVSEAINSATNFEKIKMNFDMPKALTEDKFAEKLSQNGQARKALMRLDLLSRLCGKIMEAANTLLQILPQAVQEDILGLPDIEQQVAALIPYGINSYISLGSERPAGLILRQWWDLRADSDLVLGTFLHGYGAYSKMAEDPRLCFTAQRGQSSYSDLPPSPHLKLSPSMTKERFFDDEDKISSRPLPNSGLHRINSGSTRVSARSPFSNSAQAEENAHSMPGVCSNRRSKFIGVFAQPGSLNWLVLLPNRVSRVQTRCDVIGIFSSEEDASKAYDNAIRDVMGDLAVTNWLPNGDLNENIEAGLLETEQQRLEGLPFDRPSLYRGVRANGCHWVAHLQHGYIVQVLGSYDTEIEAALAHDHAVMQQRGDQAQVNFRNRTGANELIAYIHQLEREAASSGHAAMHDESSPISTSTSVSVKINQNYCNSTSESESNDEDDNAMLTYAPAPKSPNSGPIRSNKPKIDQSQMPDVRILNKHLAWLLTLADSDKINLNQSQDGDESKNVLEQKSKAKKLCGNSSYKAMIDHTRPLGSGITLSNVKLEPKEGGEIKVEDKRLGGIAPVISSSSSTLVWPNSQENEAIRQICLWHSALVDQKLNTTSDEPPNLDNWFQSPNQKRTCNSQMRAQSNPNSWSFWERKMFCAALLAKGAPLCTPQNESSGIQLGSQFTSVLHAMQTQGEFGFKLNKSAKEESDVMSNNCSVFKWADVIHGTQISESPAEVSAYYYGHFLPLCVDLCHPAMSDISISAQEKNGGVNATIDSKSMDSHGNEENHTESALSFFPDPKRSVQEHSAVARGVAYIFIRRQQMLRTVQYVLYNRSKALISWASSRRVHRAVHVRARLKPRKKPANHSEGLQYSTNEEMPIWWCPWIHDLAVLVGCLKHGLLNINAMRVDNNLPLTPASISHHIMRSLVTPIAGGRMTISGLCDAQGCNISLSQENTTAWVAQLSCQFPTRRALENRIFAICVLMTQHLPPDDPRKLSQFGGQSIP